MHGYSVVQKDLNIESYDIFLSPEHILSMKQKIKERFELLDNKERLSVKEQEKFVAFFMGMSKASRIHECISEAMTLIKNEDNFYNINDYNKSMNTINEALSITSLAYFPTNLSLFSFTIDNFDYSISELFKATIDEEINPYIQIYKDNLLKPIVNLKPDLVCISIIGTEQIIPGLTIARLLKLETDSHINIGGSIFSRLVDVLLSRKELFTTFFDSVITLEGEKPLLELVKHIENKKDLKSVPNLIFLDGESVCKTDISRPERIDNLPTPSFEGFPLDKYLSPLLVLPYLSSRGCYFNKCAFCDHSYIYGNRYDPRDIKKVVDDLNKLTNKYGCHHFTFSDECISPSRFDKLSDELINTKSTIFANADIRFEKGFTSELCNKIYNSGFRVFYIGMESANNRVLSFMNKGIDKDSILNIISNSSSAGIWNHVFYFLGFPTETETEAEETLDILISKKDQIHSSGGSTFLLGKDSKVAHNPKKYSVKNIKIDQKKDLELWYNYDIDVGLSNEMAQRLLSSFKEQIEKDNCDYCWSSIPREHLLIYLSRYRVSDLKDMIKIPYIKQDPRIYYNDYLNDNAILYMHKHLAVHTINFDITELINNKFNSPIVSELTNVVYNEKSKKIFKINNSAKKVIDLLDNVNTVGDVINKIAINYGISLKEARIKCNRLFTELLNNDIVGIANSTGSIPRLDPTFGRST
ncbi:radical SAM domain-containing protein [Methanosarcina barkeri CM1]|nr:radical SAM domain-containing protein [Methanosarcina barkeri CM1]